MTSKNTIQMAKRFIQHEVLRNPWLRVAPTQDKLLWIGLITECDHAGIWIVDWPMMELMVGGKIDVPAARKFLEGRFIEVDNGRRWFLPDFVKFQYPQGVATGNNAMKSVRQILDNYGIDQETLLLKEGLANPSPTLGQGLQDKDKDIDREKDKSVRARETESKPKILVTNHRGKTVDWYEKQLQEAIDVSTPELKKLGTEIGERYAPRLACYKSLVELMVNGDALDCPRGMHDTVLMLKDQLTFHQYSKLADDAKSPAPIREIITEMHNSYTKNVKGKTTVYKTALNWLQRRISNPASDTAKSKVLSNPKKVTQ